MDTELNVYLKDMQRELFVEYLYATDKDIKSNIYNTLFGDDFLDESNELTFEDIVNENGDIILL